MLWFSTMALQAPQTNASMRYGFSTNERLESADDIFPSAQAETVTSSTGTPRAEGKVKEAPRHCFGTRAVKMWTTSTSTVEGKATGKMATVDASFICAADGSQMAVAKGEDAVESMKRYYSTGLEEDIASSCAFSSVTCAPAPSPPQLPCGVCIPSIQTGKPCGRVLMAATIRGNCSVAVIRSDGTFAFSSCCGSCEIPCTIGSLSTSTTPAPVEVRHPHLSQSTETEIHYFYAAENDIVLLQTKRMTKEVKHLLQDSVLAREDLETIAEDVLDLLVQGQDPHGANGTESPSASEPVLPQTPTETSETVIIAKLGELDCTANQPPETLC
jgi:hypothetical protein